jgi:hypothetical protein
MTYLILRLWFDKEMTDKTCENENHGSQEGSKRKEVRKIITEVDVDVTVEIEGLTD